MAASEARRESMHAVDAAWLHMDTPTSPMVITAMMEFERPLPRDALAGLVSKRLLVHPRFRQRAVGPSSRSLRPAWEDDPLFDLRSHLHHVALPAPGGRAQLADLVSDLMSTPLAATRPLWQIHLVDGVGEGSAVIVRVHHCIADGVSLVRLLLELADQAPREPVKVGRLREPMRGPLERLSLLADEARALARLLLLAPDPPTPLSVPLGTRKRAAWSDAIPLDRLVAIAHAQDGTLNDVLLAATTAALRRDLERRLALVPALEVRAMMPVNLRPVEGAAEELGNRFGLVYVPLPLGTAAPLPRLREVKRRLDEIKASPEAAVSLGVLGVMGLLTASAERLGVDLFTHKSTVLATNVPGPPTPMRIAGQLLRRLLVWAPVSGRMGISFSFLSYAGTLTLGLGADEGCMPDPDAVVRDFVADLDALAAAATP